jgi:exopolyphosphatase/pppGpp-phosphohydrolase
MQTAVPDPGRLAVIDIGSNTAALAVYAVSEGGGIDRLLDRSEPLRLIRRIGPDGRLPGAVLDRIIETMSAFAATARQNGAERIDVVATSAVRDARNSDELARRLRAAVGLRMRVLDGAAEAVAAACAVVNTLPLTDGFVIDIGGGSMQIVEVRDRACARRVSLPLGALRLTDRFRTEGLPGPAEVTALRRHVDEELRRVPWFRADAGVTLVGVGGTIRSIAKTERRGGLWPIVHGHGYRLDLDAVEAAWERMSRLDATRRREIPGLASHRVDTIPAGSCVVLRALRASGFDALRVCTYGVREGVALQRAFGAEAPLVTCPRVEGLLARVPCAPEEAEALRRARGAAIVLQAALADRYALEEGDCAERTVRWEGPLKTAAHVQALLRLRAGSVEDGAAAPPDAAEALLRAPLQGAWQEESLAAADLLSAAPRFGMDATQHRRLRSLVELACGAESDDVRATADDGRLLVQGLRWSSGAERRFHAAFGLRLRAA